MGYPYEQSCRILYVQRQLRVYSGDLLVVPRRDTKDTCVSFLILSEISFQATKIPACMLRETLDTEFFNSFCMEFSPRRLHCLAISAQGKVRSSILTSSRNVQFITKLIC